MNFKTLLITFLLLLVVGIGCVSATDNSSLEEISSDEITDNVISVDETVDDISTSDAEEIVSDSESSQSTYTWTDFKSDVENTDNSIVKLNQSSITPSSDSNDQIKLNHDVTIVGGYGYYIGSDSWNNAVPYNYIPIITSGSNLNVNFENVTFQYLSNNIFVKLMGNGNFAFKNCVFNNINCTGDHQSVIWLNYGYALIENCTFTNVKSSFGAVTNYYTSWGTAVNNARMTVRNSTFKNNYATTEPGAINNCGKLEVYDSTFENNEAYWWAGAIHTHSNANTTIVGSNFINNLAGWNGGALYTYSYLKVINSTFIGNNATTNTGGGAIGASNYMSKPTVIIENSRFNDNIALTGNGGAIVISSGTLTVDKSNFTNNVAVQLNGGAIASAGSTATITNSIFKYNSAPLGKGGAVYGAGNGRLTVDYCVFTNNTAKDDDSGHALAYYYTGTSQTAAYLTYTNNQFYGPNNGAGSVYAANDKLNVNHYNNTIEDISNYIEPEEENTTNGTSGEVIPIPSGTTGSNVTWSVSLGDTLTGTPVISGNYIVIPANHTLYCYYLNGTQCWNLTSISEYNTFYEVTVDNGIIYAPCSLDKLYILDLATGVSLTDANLYQASSIYAPLVVGDTIYVSGEYAYGSAWIAVVKYVNGNYTYLGNILEIDGLADDASALLSAPVLDVNGNLWVNTINGAVCINLNNGSKIVDFVSGTVGNIVMDADDYIYVMANIGGESQILYFDPVDYSMETIEIDEIGNYLAIDNNKENAYTVSNNGIINIIYLIDKESDGTDSVINGISSAICVNDNLVYVGDSAGILWVFNSNSILSWAFNATSPIVGGIAVNNNIAYIGTEDGTFYAVKSF